MTRWIEIGALNDIPRLGSRVVRTPGGDIAVFRTESDEVFALDDRCPHKGGPLSQGIVHNKRVTCPLHNFVIELGSGQAASVGALFEAGGLRVLACRSDLADIPRCLLLG